REGRVGAAAVEHAPVVAVGPPGVGEGCGQEEAKGQETGFHRRGNRVFGTNRRGKATASAAGWSFKNEAPRSGRPRAKARGRAEDQWLSNRQSGSPLGCCCRSATRSSNST